jgi:hypothetical protein
LEKQLARVRDTNSRDLSFVTARAALKRIGSVIRDHNETTLIADVDMVRIGDFEETLLQELCSSMRNLAITFHFTEAQTTVTSTTLHRLSIHHLNWTASTRVNFVVDHVLQALIVGWAEENLSRQLASSVTIVHNFISAQMVIIFAEQCTDLLHVDCIVERSRVTDFTLVGRKL